MLISLVRDKVYKDLRLKEVGELPYSLYLTGSRKYEDNLDLESQENWDFFTQDCVEIRKELYNMGFHLSKFTDEIDLFEKNGILIQVVMDVSLHFVVNESMCANLSKSSVSLLQGNQGLFDEVWKVALDVAKTYEQRIICIRRMEKL